MPDTIASTRPPIALLVGAGLGAAMVCLLGGAPGAAHAGWVSPVTLAEAPVLDGTKAPGTKKNSPYAAAKEAAPAPAEGALGGTKAPGSQRDSPYAAAKETVAAALTPSLGKLWGLLVPIVLAAGSYLYLRSSEVDPSA